MVNFLSTFNKPILIKNSELSSLFLIAVVVLSFLLSGCAPQAQAPAQERVVYSGPMMGTQYRIIVLIPAGSKDEVTSGQSYYGVIEKNVVDAMASVNQSMSTYLPSSELSSINNAPAGQVLDLSTDLYEVIAQSMQISKLSDGAFDITIGNAVNLWGFGSNGSIVDVPDDAKIARLKKSIGYHHIELDKQSLLKRVEGVYIDLSAIAKGYAVDRVADALSELGITNYLIDIGGELRASGFSLNNQSWRVGIEKPYTLGGIQEVVTLGNHAIATSGDYRNYHVIDGRQYSHTIDAKTLVPTFHKLALVSVISDRASTADALATAMMALGEKRGMAFAIENDLAVYMVIRGEQKDQYSIEMTESFKPFVQ